jgi:hypothetical protein
VSRTGCRKLIVLPSSGRSTALGWRDTIPPTWFYPKRGPPTRTSCGIGARFGAHLTGSVVASDALDAFLSTAFEGGRHQQRIDQLAELDDERAASRRSP